MTQTNQNSYTYKAIPETKRSRIYAASVLNSGSVSGSAWFSLLTAVILVTALSVAAVKLPALAFEAAASLSGADPNQPGLPFIAAETAACALSFTLIALPGWAGAYLLADRLRMRHDYRRSYNIESMENPSPLLAFGVYKRKRYLRALVSALSGAVIYGLPPALIPTAYYIGRHVGWASPRPFDAIFVFMINIGGICCAVMLCRLLSRLSLVPRLLLERNLDPFAAIRLSYKLMQGTSRASFRLTMSFIGWALLTLVSCGISAAWSLPLFITARAGYEYNITGRDILIDLGL